MTDNDIIKALKCLSGANILCKECAYNEKFRYPDCRQEAAEDALDLINQQQAEIMAKEVEYNDMLEQCKSVEKYLEKAQAEIEMLKGWERLLKAESHAPIIKKAKAEAVKDLLIRLTMHFASYRGKDTITIKDMFQIIQKIAEEAVGDA